MQNLFILTRRADLYCFSFCFYSQAGVVAYTLLCAYEPFSGDDQQEVLTANKNVDYDFHSPDWDEISPLAKDWIRKACNPVPEKRFTPKDAKRHPWLNMFFPARTLAKFHPNQNVPMPRRSNHGRENQPPPETVEKSCIIC